MHTPDTLPTADVQAIIRLLGGLAVHTGTVTQKRRALLEGLCELVDGDGWWWVHSAVREGKAYMFSVLDGNWSNEQQKHLATTVHYTPHIEPINGAFRQYQARGKAVTLTRSQIMADGEWRASAAYREYFFPAGIEDFMGSLYPLENQLMSSIGLHRNIGRRLFSDHQRTLTHLVLTQIDWLHREGTDAPAVGKAHSLTNRQRQIMLLLLQGDSRKQIAKKLGLSEHTVADHLKAIHAHFQVSSRGELLAQFISGGKRSE